MTVTDVDVPVLQFVEPLPGFGTLSRFGLVSVDEAGTVFQLQSMEDAGISFIVVPSIAFFPDYAPEVSTAAARRLALETADDALVLLIVTVGASIVDSTANLLAPVVVNRNTLEAAQVILENSEYPVKAPLAPAA